MIPTPRTTPRDSKPSFPHTEYLPRAALFCPTSSNCNIHLVFIILLIADLYLFMLRLSSSSGSLTKVIPILCSIWILSQLPARHLGGYIICTRVTTTSKSYQHADFVSSLACITSSIIVIKRTGLFPHLSFQTFLGIALGKPIHDCLRLVKRASPILSLYQLGQRLSQVFLSPIACPPNLTPHCPNVYVLSGAPRTPHPCLSTDSWLLHFLATSPR